MSDQYYVKLTGNLLEGREPDMAAQFLSDTFHVPAETGRTYFNGEPTVLKKKLDRETAEKVCGRLRNAGAECELEEATELGLTLELVEDASAAPDPEAGFDSIMVDADDSSGDDMSLELVDVPDAESKPVSIDDLQFETDAATGDADGSDELEQPTEPEPEEMTLELAGSEEPDPEPGGTLELDELPPPAEPPPPPSLEQEEAVDEDSRSEEVDIGDVADNVGSGGGGGVGGMLPQASAAPEFKRPGQVEAEEKSSNKKLVLPLVGLVSVLVLAAAAYFLLFSGPEAPPPVVKRTVPKKVVPAKVDDSMFREFQMEELQVKLDTLAGSISTWQIQFADGATGSKTPNELREALKTDMGVADSDWVDPWGGNIQYQANESGFSLVSAGPDKKPGTDDDIKREHSQ